MGMLKSEMIHHSYQTASGQIPYNMMNDYMFRAILQKNHLVLRGLIGSLLHLDQGKMKSVKITNPIRLGEQIDSKTFILDINVLLNNDIHLNLELQVLDPSNWPERSLSYLCRMYDNLRRGQDYQDSGFAIHIGILDFTLFEEAPEFYACYKMLNVKNHHVFSDRFMLNVLDLRQVELATDEDQRYQIDRWARMFQATTWEELRMMAESDKYMSEAAAEMYMLNADEIVRQQCLAREEYYRNQRRIQKQTEQLQKQTEELKRQLVDKERQLADKEREIEELKAIISNQK